MPTNGEFVELLEYCAWEWTTVKGVNGYKITGPNDNSIFLPAAGFRDSTEICNRGTDGRYWTGVAMYVEDEYIIGLSFSETNYTLDLANLSTPWLNDFHYYHGYMVRPVKENKSVSKIADITADDDSCFVRIKGKIVATNRKCCLVDDGTGYILFTSSNEKYAIGDVVTICGLVTVNGKLLSFSNDIIDLSYQEIVKEGTTDVNYPIPRPWSEFDLGKYNTSPSVDYVVYEGTLNIDNDEYTVNIDGSTPAIGKIDYPHEGFINPDLNGRRVIVEGYTVGYTDNKYVNTIATIVELVEEIEEDSTLDESAVAEAVDLGLSVKWASWNIGATKPEGYGGHYAWGETEVKDNYDWSTYKWSGGSRDMMTKYCTDSSYGTVDNETVLAPEDDIAHVKWNEGWRMPTLDEIKELQNNCSWEWTAINGVCGYKVSANGNSIFLPAAGYRNGAEVYERGSHGYYWSGMLGEDRSYNAYTFYFNGGFSRSSSYGRYRGHTVRPVQGEVVGEEDEEHEEAILETFINVSINNGYPKDEDWGGDDDESAEPEIDADDYLEDENWGGGADESTDPEIDADDYPEDENWGDGNDESTDPEIDADDYPEDENWGGGADESTDPKIDADDYSEDENWGGGDEEFAEPEIDADDYPEDENWGSGDDESTDSDIDIEDYSSEEDWNDSGNESANSEIQMNGYADDEDWSNQ